MFKHKRDNDKHARNVEIHPRVLEGDEDAWEEMWVQARPFAKWVAKGIYVRGLEEDDIVQELMILLWRRTVHQWDPEKSTWNYYSRLAIRRHAYTLLKSSQALKRTPLNEACQIRECDVDPTGQPCVLDLWDMQIMDDWREEEDSVLSRMAEREQNKLLMDALKEELTPLERDVLDLYLRDHGYVEIARLLDGRSHRKMVGKEMKEQVKTIDNALGRIKKKAEVLLGTRKII